MGVMGARNIIAAAAVVVPVASVSSFFFPIELGFIPLILEGIKDWRNYVR